ncbi:MULTISPECIES: AMP-binding protein [Acidithrix]|uniref:Long-chain-fatty-acid--CoA ligase n=1 Tax=Acidithrix ferrooxidans TaxID=1280514 RepID=A0A0D8HFB7_9ACTN|nr:MULTISPECIES: AMP-binding protein [Acidithrix]KJF16660.1 long-chain-fatty-acid--CoA ligase [Acidithrix ferrooxidans]CAG4902810.1 unnamed protein product [Acidithrix sp. C25]
MDIDVTSLSGRRAINRWERTSIGDVIERVTWSYPNKEAIIGWEGAYGHPEFARLTYRQADELANRFANALIARGLTQSDRVLLFCENSVEAFVAKIAIAKAGGVGVPLNPSLAPDVVAELIARTQPRFSVVDSELWVRAKEAFRAAGLGVDVTIPIGGGAIDSSLTFGDFVAGYPSSEPKVVIHGDDIWEILFTSGTTALPKGAMISHSGSVMGAYSFALTLTRGIHIECDLKLATFLPIIYHVADQVFTFPAFFSGGTLIIGRRPVAESIVAAITQEKITALWGGSPAMVNALAKVVATDSGEHDISSLSVIVYGWAALSPATLQILKERAGTDLVAVEIFGQTECISCHRFWPDKWPEVYERTAPEHNYVGVPNPMLASVVVDAMGESLEGQPWVAGEAIYRSPAVTAGYYLDAAATGEAFRDGWFHSGDSCVYDEQGLRIMVDRFKDIVKSGGENVSTIRVEAILHQHPGVTKAAVIGVPDERWGEAVTAVVVPLELGGTSEGEIIAFCRERLAGFETPKSVIFVEELPETVGGKVLKYKLRQQFR